MYQIIQKRNIFLSISSIFVVASIVLLIMFGLNLGIDFTGGSLLEVKFLEARPTPGEVQSILADLDLESLVVQPVDEDVMILRFKEISEAKHQEILKVLGGGDQSADVEINAETENMEIEAVNAESQVEELRFDSVGPSIGQELKQKSITAIVLVLAAIVAYIAWVFRRVSKPVESYKYGVAAIVALFHDVVITLGVFAFLGKYYGVEINTAFVAAILTVLGYSVNDSIVVFDRIRENLPKSDEDFEGTVNVSINETISRSINTSLTTLIVLISVLVFGGESIRSFVLALSIGVFVGTYSSIFIASPLLVIWEKLKK